MSKFTSPLISSGRGKVGGLVISKWNGINTLRSYQPVVRNPRSANQIVQRSKFSGAQALAKYLRTGLSLVYPIHVPMMSKYNRFISDMIHFYTSGGTIDNLELDNIEIGNGNYPNILPISITALSGGHITIGWDALAVPFGFDPTGSQAILLFIDSTSNKGITVESGIPFVTASANTDLSHVFNAGDEITGFLCFQHTIVDPITFNVTYLYTKFLSLQTGSTVTLLA